MGDLDRIRWQCRRGMLELDLVLNRFVEAGLEGLSPEQLDVFKAFLGENDTRLLAWVMGQEEPPAQYAALVRQLQQQ
ncbi:MAG: succinate dehydrogenase assembly factor 2 [Burkholderiales bacterium]|nr:succinate dehydrogenase assembly factor 2 [Burkholderiales bacterium]